MNEIKKSAILLLIIGIVMLASCTQKIKWIKNKNINGIEFKKIRYSYNESDTISIIAYMDNDNDIQGVPCKKGWVHFSKEKDLKMFCLNSSYKWGNIQLPCGSWIINAQDTAITTVVLPNDTVIQNYPVSGGKSSSGTRTVFYKNGNLKCFFPSKDFVKDDIQYVKSMIKPVRISPEGKLCQK